MVMRRVRSRRAFRKFGRRSSYKRFAYRVRKIVNGSHERKYNANTLVSQFPTISTTWTEVSYGAISQGDDIFSMRQGRRIAITGFYATGTIQGGQSNIATDDRINTIRIVGTVANVTTPMATGGHDINAFIGKRNNATLLYKWMDRYVTLESPGRDSTGYMPAIKHIKIFHRFKKPVIIDYQGTGASTWNKTIVLSMLSDSGVAPSPGFVLGQVRMIYKDI